MVFLGLVFGEAVMAGDELHELTAVIDVGSSNEARGQQKGDGIFRDYRCC